MRIAVADTGPLIHLSEIGQLGLLAIFDTLLMPDAVWAESIQPGRLEPEDILVIDGIQRLTVRPASLTQFVEENALQHLQNGEQECLYLCQQVKVETILTDDLAARDAAKRLDLTPVGSLGIVIRAYSRGLISLAGTELALADLYDVSSLFITRAIVETAIEQLRARASQE